MNFGITIKHERKNIHLLVDKVSGTKTQEKYKVIARNQSFVLQNNRPLLIAKGLKYFPVTSMHFVTNQNIFCKKHTHQWVVANVILVPFMT